MTTYDEIKLAEAVDAGAEFMDAIDREWFWIVDPERLDMRKGFPYRPGGPCCVLAQHHPRQQFFSGDYGLDLTDDAPALGFVTTWQGRRAYGQLTALWREAIYDRRSAYFDRHPELVISR